MAYIMGADIVPAPKVQVAPTIGITAGVAGVNKQNLQNAVNKNKGTTGTDTGTGPKVEAPTSGYGGYDASAAYLAMLQAQLAAQRAAAEEAYGRNMERIASSYDSASGNLRSNYDSAVDRLNAARNKSFGEVNSDAEKSLREAYINNMLSKKNLNQRLSAMGYNGGATETSMASLANQYGNSRTDINEVLNRNISNLEQTYGDNLAQALQSYNSAMSNLDLQKMQMEMQAEQMLQNAISGSMSGIGSLLSMDQSYLNALSGALNNQAAYTYDPTKATNDFVAGQSVQAQSASNSGTNWAKQLAAQGLTGQDLKAKAFELYQNGQIDQNVLYNIIYGNR